MTIQPAGKRPDSEPVQTIRGGEDAEFRAFRIARRAIISAFPEWRPHLRGALVVHLAFAMLDEQARGDR
jgi:hypothetical protein